MSMVQDALRSGLSYLRENPFFLLRAARNAAHLNLSVPLDVLRWFIERRPRGKGPERIEISASPPALGVGLTVDLYGTKLDVSASIIIEKVDTQDGLKVALRVRDLALQAPPNTPAAMMVQSLDLKRPANLLNMMPQKHGVIVSAKDDLFELDLLKVRKLAENRTLRRVLDAFADVASLREVRTEEDLLILGLGVNLTALPSALLRLRSAN